MADKILIVDDDPAIRKLLVYSKLSCEQLRNMV